MATLVETVESQREAERAGRRNWRRWPKATPAVLLVSGLTLFAMAVGGYHPYAEDGGLYVAGVKRLLDPALYPHGTVFVLEPMRLSLFAPSVAGIVRASHVGLPPVLLAVHLASIWATLFAAWMLASRCWPGRTARIGAVVLLACWLTLPVAGTALLFMDPYVTARSFSTPAMVLALVGALDMTGPSNDHFSYLRSRRGYLLCAAGLLFAAVMHPLMAIYALGATLMLVCIRSRRSFVRIGGVAALCAIALAAAAVAQWIARPEGAGYVRVALTRTYWFPATWSWYELIGLAAPLAILAAFAWRSSSRFHSKNVGGDISDPLNALAQMSIAVGTTAWFIAMLFARVSASNHLVARMQPLRAFQVVYLVMVLALGAKLGERVLRRSMWRWASVILLLGGVMLSAERSAFPHSNHLELPRIPPRNPWTQAFLWIRANAPTDALFALDPDYINAPGEDAQCFRAIAERSALPDYSKDGGEASIAPDLAEAWAEGQTAQRGLSAPWTTDAQRFATLTPMGVTWVVLKTGAVTSLECPYGNSAVRVCRLR